MQKAGFVVIVGRSNTGKSTLLNSLVGTKVAITSQKPQTTRFPIQGIVTDPDHGQIVFVDTPGLFHKSGDVLTEKLNQSIAESVRDIDVVLYLVDAHKPMGSEERDLLKMLAHIPKEKKIMVMNKMDNPEAAFAHEFERNADEFTAILKISALNQTGLGALKEQIFSMLPESPEPYFPAGQLTTMDNRKWTEELIREKVFQYTKDEIPYAVNVEVREQKEEKGMVVIGAAIITSEERYKKILIGRGGSKIKEIGMAARKELEAVLMKKVYVGLEVEVDKHWQERYVTHQ